MPFRISMLPTHISQVKGPVGPEDNGKDGEDSLQESKLEGAKFEQEERAPGVGTEEIICVTRLWQNKVLVSKPLKI